VRWISGPAIERPLFLAHLARLVTEGRFDHVLPLTEAAMARLWDAPGPWSDRLHPITDARQRRLLRDKHALTAHMATRGIDVPAERRLDDALDLDERGARARPAARGQGRDRLGRPARADRREPRGAGAGGGPGPRARGGWALQELIAGPTYLVGGLFRAGEAVRIYAALKLEQHPRAPAARSTCARPTTAR